VSTPPSYARFYRAFALLVALVAAASSVAATLRFAWGLRSFGGVEYLPRVVALSTIREYAPGVVSAMALFAWLVQSHGWDRETARQHFRPLAFRAALSTWVGYWPTLAIMLAVSVSLSAFLYDVEPRQFGYAARKTIDASDFLDGMRACLLNTITLLVIGFFAVPRFAASGWRLPTKALALWLGLGLLGLAIDVLDAVIG
jgi:hypothetical protein